MNCSMMRLKSITKGMPIPRSTLYDQIKDGVFTKPVRIGDRAVAWPTYEVEAIFRARIAGKDKAQMRELVASLHLKRQGLNDELQETEATK